MDIKTNGNIVEVDGIIKTINDSQILINAIKENAKTGSVLVKINDSFSLPSTVIGELLKLKDNGVSISLEVKDEILYELLDDLNLVSAFNVKKI
jgi:hypothetical protein